MQHNYNPDMDFRKLTVRQIHMKARRWRYCVQADMFHMRLMHSKQLRDLDRRMEHMLEAQVASLAEGHTWTFNQPANWWQHLKADLAEWLDAVSMNWLDDLVQADPARRWLRLVAQRIDRSVRVVSQTKSAYALYPTVPIPPNVGPEDVFVVFSS